MLLIFLCSPRPARVAVLPPNDFVNMRLAFIIRGGLLPPCRMMLSQTGSCDRLNRALLDGRASSQTPCVLRPEAAPCSQAARPSGAECLSDRCQHRPRPPVCSQPGAVHRVLFHSIACWRYLRPSCFAALRTEMIRTLLHFAPLCKVCTTSRTAAASRNSGCDDRVPQPFAG